MTIEAYRGQARYRAKQAARMVSLDPRVRGLVGQPSFARISTVEKIDTSGECWVWTGAINEAGYGRVGNRYVHRAVYEALVGPIPEGHHLDHLCRVTRCCNPDHLEPVTHLEHASRRPGWRTCKRGHDLKDPANVYVRRGGGVMCRPCRSRVRENNRLRKLGRESECT